MDAYLGMICSFGFDFQPGENWVVCDGRSLPVSDYMELYTLIMETYGGDGNTFNVPDLRGRVPIGYGDNLGLGSFGGNENITLNQQNLPAHSHIATVSNMPVNAKGSDSQVPVDAYLSLNTDTTGNAFATGVAKETIVNMALSGRQTSSQAGGNSSINIQSPYTTINYCICVKGIFPTRPRD